MKTVFTSSATVIHLFAQRSQAEAHCSNVFFENNRIWSYGRHYLLAEFIKNNSGNEAIMINNTGYSVTTAKHITEVIQATRQFKQFFELQTNPQKVLNQLELLVDKLSKAKKPELYINPAEYLFNQFNEFQAWKGETNDKENLLKIRSIINVFRGQDYLIYLNEKQAIIKQAEKLRIKELKKQFKKELKEFLTYKRNYIYRNFPDSEDYLRISQDGENIETSQSVRVPVKLAKTLYLMIKNGKDIKGYNIAGYTVIGLNGVLKIGCHKINLKNMTEIGERLLTINKAIL
jgi:hypothetical protein